MKRQRLKATDSCPGMPTLPCTHSLPATPSHTHSRVVMIAITSITALGGCILLRGAQVRFLHMPDVCGGTTGPFRP